MNIEKQIESERITNLSEFEQIVLDARQDVICLQEAIRKDRKEAANHLAEQLDLKLHRMESFEFEIERRTITARDHNECQ